ncbi:MAG: ribose-5-phosphate isomerase RpiA [Pseudomonadota bacterium]
MSTDDGKRAAAQAALDFLDDDLVLGIGTGSTVNQFIDLLADRARDLRLRAMVSSSQASTERLQRAGFTVSDLNEVGSVDLYVDGADEATRHLQLIKGGGGALTREKIIAGAARKFVCIADASKLVNVLGTFPLPVEVIPMARSFVARQLVAAGGRPVLREGVVTDNGNQVIDVHGLDLVDPSTTERALNQIPGVVTVGLFALRGADELLIGTDAGIERHTRRR